jgi:RNA methyltransferase, TrmH family
MREPLPGAGSFKKVTSPANPLIKEIRALHQKKERDASGLFIAEGQKLVRDAAEQGWPIQILVYSAANAQEPHIGALAAQAKAGGGIVLEASAQVLEKISRRDNPQNVIGVFRQRFASETLVAKSGIWIALDRVRDPGNLGTIIRTADAAELSGVALVGQSCDPFGLEAVRASMGSIFNVALTKLDEERLGELAKQHGARLVGTHLSAATEDFRRADYRAPLILLMGNEQQGLTTKLAAACDALVRIPMREGADSLNLAVSAGLMIYEALRNDRR